MKGILLAFCILALATMASAAHLSMHQMANLWKLNKGMDCQTAVAIGYATSLGNTKAQVQSSLGGKDRGLWGINSISSPQVAKSCALEASCGARAAIELSNNGADWTRFASYIDGLHMAHMRNAGRACGPSGFDEMEEKPVLYSSGLNWWPEQTAGRRLKRRRPKKAAVSMETMAMIWKMQGGNDCKTAVAVGWATSMGDPNSANPAPNGGMDRGLWGLNSVDAHGVSTQCAFDAECGAKATIQHSKNGADWSKFSAYVTGMHVPHIPLAKQACGPNHFDTLEEEDENEVREQRFGLRGSRTFDMMTMCLTGMINCNRL